MIEKFRRAGQAQVFAFFGQLPPDAQKRLLEQAAEIDLDEIERLTRTLLAPNAAAGVNLEGLAPAPYERRPENGGDSGAWAKAKAAGEEALRAGRVAAFTVAGGQGTRLGYEGPKGAFPITPVKRKPLFQVFAEKIRTAGMRYGQPLHWFIMTSHANHAATEAFFGANGFFGLERHRVHFFRQGRMPAVDFDGRILLESPESIALSPDGHGGSLRALDRSGSLDLMQSEGIDTLSYFQVDNPLIRVIDPEFIGWHLLRGSEMSGKMVPKAYPEEKVGHFCVQDGKLVVVEYSDLPLAMQRETDASGRLRYIAGSIAIHILDREFVRRMAHSTGSGQAHSTSSGQADSASSPQAHSTSSGQAGSTSSPQAHSTSSGQAHSTDSTSSPQAHSTSSGQAHSTGSPQADSTGSPQAGGMLPFHRADKKVATIDAEGRSVRPERPNGVKFEMFVFDAVPFARNPVVIETRRENDFSPVKNATGVDSPQTCRDDQLRQFARWVLANGGEVETDSSGLPRVAFEVSPLFGCDEDSFAEAWGKLPAKPVIRDGLYLE